MQKGFSFIELLIVMVIISLLTTFAYPMYTTYFLKVKRIEAQLTLFDLAARIESTNVESYRYQEVLTPEHFGVASTTQSKGHTISIQGHNIRQYHLVATTHSQDKQCTQLSYNYLGERDFKGSGQYKECWCA